MEEQILDIAKKLYHNHLTPETATNLLLDLLSDKRQSEEYYCEVDEFGRHEVPCARQCKSCFLMESKR